MAIMQTRLMEVTLAQCYPETGERNFIGGYNHYAGGFILPVCFCVPPRLTATARKPMSPRVVISGYHYQHACEQHSSQKTGRECAGIVLPGEA